MAVFAALAWLFKPNTAVTHCLERGAHESRLHPSLDDQRHLDQLAEEDRATMLPLIGAVLEASNAPRPELSRPTAPQSDLASALSSAEAFDDDRFDDPVDERSTISDGWQHLPDAMPCCNPATGLPMCGDGPGGMDIAGNPYGMDCSHDIDGAHSAFDASTGWDWDSGACGGFDDSWGGSQDLFEEDGFSSSSDDW